MNDRTATHGPDLPRRATIIDVANAAGVSRQTVTRAMNDMSDISPGTRARVRQVAEDLGYVPNRAARAMVRGGQPTLGLVLPDLTNPYYPEVAVGVMRRATELGWNVIVSDTTHSADRLEAALEDMTRQVDAVVGYFPEEPGFLGELWRQLPVVCLEHELRSDMFGLVSIDFEPGIRSVLDFLASLGRSRVAVVDLALPDGRLTKRRIATRQWAKDNPETELELAEFTAEGDIDGGLDVTDQILAANPDTDAIIAFNDVSAFGILKGLSERGIRVPGDVNVIGIDGLSIGRMVTPELSSLYLDKLKFGEVAVDLVTAMARRELPFSGSAVRRSVAHTFMQRSSTSVPK